MNTMIIGFLLASATGFLYSYSLYPAQAQASSPNLALIAALSAVRIFCMGLFLYCLLNSSPIHSILMMIIFGIIVWIKR